LAGAKAIKKHRKVGVFLLLKFTAKIYVSPLYPGYIPGNQSDQ
jgi:hypothetical protein